MGATIPRSSGEVSVSHTSGQQGSLTLRDELCLLAEFTSDL